MREQQEKEQRNREERERVERERAARQLASTTVDRMEPLTPPAVDFESTQQQRHGVVTQSLSNNSMREAEPPPPAWQQQSQQGFQASAAPGFLGGAEQPKKSSMPLILAAAVIGFVVLVGGGIGVYFMTRSTTPEPKPPVVNNGGGTEQGGQVNQQTTGTKAEMIAIPGGTFQMGRNNGPDLESPAHQVTVGSFAMDNTEVTNAEYLDFVRETNHAPPSHWAVGEPLSGQEQWPVTNVSIDDAKAFAAWRSKRDGVTYRLPTEEEWEYAARGGDQGNLYPWGNSWSANRAVVDESSPKAVGSFPGRQEPVGSAGFSRQCVGVDILQSCLLSR